MRPPPYAHHFNAMSRAGRERIVLTLAGCLLFVALHAQEIFLARWWVWAAAFALGGRSTFMPARKNRRAGQMSQPERKIMKTRNTPSMFMAILLSFLALGATKAQAIIDIYRPVGITFGQTARVNILNTGDSAFIIDGGKFLDSDGNVIAEFRGTIDPGKTMSFDLNG